jgi:regulator of sigma D
MMCLQVTVAFCAPEGMRALEAACGRAAKQALEMFCSAVSHNAAQLA